MTIPRITTPVASLSLEPTSPAKPGHSYIVLERELRHWKTHQCGTEWDDAAELFSALWRDTYGVRVWLIHTDEGRPVEVQDVTEEFEEWELGADDRLARERSDRADEERRYRSGQRGF